MIKLNKLERGLYQYKNFIIKDLKQDFEYQGLIESSEPAWRITQDDEWCNDLFTLKDCKQWLEENEKNS